MKIKNKWLRLALIALVLLVLIGGTLRQSAEAPDTAETPALTLVTASPEENAPPEESPSIAEDGSYTTRDDVALYLHSYGHLPANFVTKGEARKAGWNGSRTISPAAASGATVSATVRACCPPHRDASGMSAISTRSAPPRAGSNASSGRTTA